MRRIRRTEVTVETDEITIIRRSHEITPPLCMECSRASMITPDQAAMMTGTNIRAIYRWLEAGWVHYSESSDGSVLVCPESILKLAVKTYLTD